MAGPTSRTVAIIDNSIFPEVYKPVEHWSAYLDGPWEGFVARRGRFPDPARFSHIILTGSEASILERESWVEDEAAMVREAASAGTVLLGSCWGHQLLVYALAGEGHVRRAAQPEIGWIALRLERTSDLLGPAGASPYVFSSHFDEVFDLPPQFEVLASTEACSVQAFHVAGAPIWGVQCHPEIDIPTGTRFIRDLLDQGFKGQEALQAALDGPPRDSGLIRPIVRTFLAAG